MRNVFVVGVGMTPLGKHLDKSVKDLSRLAVAGALADARIDLNELGAAWFCNTRQGVLEGQHGIRGQAVFRAMGSENLPIFNTDNACASSSSGLMQAYAAVRAGVHDTALVLGCEKMNFPDRRREMFDAFKGSWDRDLFDVTLEGVRALGDGVAVPPGLQDSSGERSVFMDMYAAMARYHMSRFGTRLEHLAAVAAKNHQHSTLNPYAQYRFPMSVEQVLSDRWVSWPLTRAMCAPMSDGAAAVILASDAALARFDRSRAVRIRGIGVASGSSRHPSDDERSITRVAANRAYEMASLGPDEVHVAEVHDATAFAEILQCEGLDFCEPGEGGPMALRGETSLHGRLPINVSGGLLSKGHPVGATGAIQIFELVTQLRGEAGPRQVTGARVALAENGGGFHGIEEAACVVSILEAPASL